MPKLSTLRIITSYVSWSDPSYIIFCTLIILFVISGAYCIHCLNRDRSEAEWRAFTLRPQYDLSRKSNLRKKFEKSNAARQMEDIERRIRKQSEMAGMLLALLAGICGSQTVCQIKEVEAFWAITEFEGLGYLFSAQAIWAASLLITCAFIQVLVEPAEYSHICILCILMNVFTSLFYICIWTLYGHIHPIILNCV